MFRPLILMMLYTVAPLVTTGRAWRLRSVPEDARGTRSDVPQIQHADTGRAEVEVQVQKVGHDELLDPPRDAGAQKDPSSRQPIGTTDAVSTIGDRATFRGDWRMNHPSAVP